MNRPAKHSESAFLSAAVGLFAEGGIEAVTMARVARVAGAPSGSLYHRFGDRPTLLYHLWRRSEQEFEAAFVRLTSTIANADEALTAVAGVVDWCRDNVASAVVLQSGPRELLSATWPEAAQREQRRARRRRGAQLTELATEIGTRLNRPADEVSFTLLEVPLAVVRPHLQARRRPPGSTRELAVRIAERLLRSPRK